MKQCDFCSILSISESESLRFKSLVPCQSVVYFGISHCLQDSFYFHNKDNCPYLMWACVFCPGISGTVFVKHLTFCRVLRNRIIIIFSHPLLSSLVTRSFPPCPRVLGRPHQALAVRMKRSISLTEAEPVHAPDLGSGSKQQKVNAFLATVVLIRAG